MTGKQAYRGGSRASKGSSESVGNRQQSTAIDSDRNARMNGSALLIVLGFLSFMTISAVSFAIYMRIEREASSNYRQTAMSRHLLNTALVRAMDEVDSELRITGYTDSDRKMDGGRGAYKELPDDVAFVAETAPPFKFPLHWPGRVRCSAVANASGNLGNTRVLSLDALAYLPASLVNDVRRWAVPNEMDYAGGGSKFGDRTELNEVGETIRAYNSAQNWRGAKWRPIYLPLGSFEGANIVNARSQIGRYAYVCVNLSDMLDVNKCRALSENVNGVSNRLDIGYLFNGLSEQTKFDETLLTDDRYYANIADFYSCMNQHKLTPFSRGGGDQTPYHHWIATQTNGGDKERPDGYFGGSGAEGKVASTGIFCTDGIVKAEPRDGSKGFNLKTQQLFRGNDASILGATPAPGTGFSDAELSDKLGDALERITSGGSTPWTPSQCQKNYGPMLADYLDLDRIPRALNTPCMERAPQINRVFFPQDDFLKAVVTYEDKTLPNSEDEVERTWKYFLEEKSQEWVFVQTLFPFRRDANRDKDTFSCALRARIYLGVGEEFVPRELSILKDPDEAKRTTLSATEELLFTDKLVDKLSIKAGYRSVNLKPDGGLSFKDREVTVTEVVQKGSSPTLPKEWQGKTFNVCMVFVGYVWQGTGKKPNAQKLVDIVPMNRQTYTESELLGSGGNSHKLYFSSAPVSFAGSPDASGKMEETVQWQWTNLECPDARFNFRISNWVANQSNTGDVKETADAAETGARAAAEKAGAALAARLMGADGRDGDWFQLSGDTGAIRSPGEFGLFPRPYKVRTGGDSSSDDLVKDLAGAGADVVGQCANYAGFYRTIRLYDHGDSQDADKKRDPVFRYLYYANEDGTLDGARVNPLSDMPLVLTAAVYGMPQDYYYSDPAVYGENEKKFVYGGATGKDNLFGENDWTHFTNSWSKCLVSARTRSLDGHPGIPAAERFTGGGVPTLATSYAYNLSDIYGDDAFFGWYSDGDETKLFKGNDAGAPEAGFAKPLPECYRKMIYGYSLDSFSDRQQLFLYIICAEAVVPSMSSSVASRSLAGGRAVALVWRDPYPAGYTKTVSGDRYTENWAQVSDLYKGASNNEVSRRVSPWYQYGLNSQHGGTSKAKDEFGMDDTTCKDDGVRREEMGSLKGAYHEQRLLFFKILDD